MEGPGNKRPLRSLSEGKEKTTFEMMEAVAERIWIGGTRGDKMKGKDVRKEERDPAKRRQNLRGVGPKSSTENQEPLLKWD